MMPLWASIPIIVIGFIPLAVALWRVRKHMR